MEMETDEALMLGVRTGSREAFEELFARYKEPVFGFFRRRVLRDELAEDLTQETFLAVLRGAKRYEPRSSFRSYLFAIAFRLLLADRRKSKRDLEISTTRDAGAHSPSDDSLWVRDALSKLEETEREILMLREYEQLSYTEIAELLRLPVNTVRSRLFRSRMALRTLLQEA
jgi:RNA polymerase sigma-70 factor (ECF subfamily)